MRQTAQNGHKRWTSPMKEAIDHLLNEHHGKKDMLKLVDQEYAATVHNSSTDPNSMLHPTTKLHIAQYVKHLPNLLNTSSSLNTLGKLLQTQRLWHSLTMVTINPAVVNPVAPALTTPLTHKTIERIVEGIMERQQQHHGQNRKRNLQTKTRLTCGLTNPRMSFKEFMETEFFQRELYATKNEWNRMDCKKEKGLNLSI